MRRLKAEVFSGVVDPKIEWRVGGWWSEASKGLKESLYREQEPQSHSLTQLQECRQTHTLSRQKPGGSSYGETARLKEKEQQTQTFGDSPNTKAAAGPITYRTGSPHCN